MACGGCFIELLVDKELRGSSFLWIILGGKIILSGVTTKVSASALGSFEAADATLSERQITKTSLAAISKTPH